MTTIPSSQSLDPRARRWGIAAKYAALLVVGFVVAPYVFTAITGLVGLIAAGVILGVTWMVLPAAESFAANMRIKLIKHEASKNPIESLEQEYLRRTQMLNERKVKIETLAAKTAGFGTKLKQFKRDYPSEASTYQEIYDKMVLLLDRSRDQWVLGEQKLVEFNHEIDKAKAKWDMALAAADLRQDAGQVEQEFFAKLRVECSFDTIELGMNSAFAQLDTLLMESEAVQSPAAAPKAIENGSTVIDIAPAATTKTRVAR